jgi:hypothetical protein
MAGKKGQSGPPDNANAFRQGLAAVQRRRADGALTVEEQDIRSDILAGLIADKGGIATYTASSASEGLRNVCRISGLTAFGSAEFYVSSGRYTASFALSLVQSDTRQRRDVLFHLRPRIRDRLDLTP